MTTQGKPAIHAQLAAIMADVTAVGKDGRNSQQGYNFRAIEMVMNTLHPIFAQHKVFILPEVVEDKTEERVTGKGSNLIYRILRVKFAFVSGEDGSRETVTTVGEGMDSGDKAANKAMTAAFKYALAQLVILPYAGLDDGDADTPPESRKGIPEGTRMTSAYDGRTIKPNEDPRPKDVPKETTKEPAKETGQVFNARLYQMMELSGVSRDELNADLRKKGIITGKQTIDTMPEHLVNLLLDGKDKSGVSNWDMVVERIQKGRNA